MNLKAGLPALFGPVFAFFLFPVSCSSCLLDTPLYFPTFYSAPQGIPHYLPSAPPPTPAAAPISSSVFRLTLTHTQPVTRLLCIYWKCVKHGRVVENIFIKLWYINNRRVWGAMLCPALCLIQISSSLISHSSPWTKVTSEPEHQAKLYDLHLPSHFLYYLTYFLSSATEQHLPVQRFCCFHLYKCFSCPLTSVKPF